ncbi:MAG: hypothetical protein NT029_16845 [Armatimonadetes bacterium]|nr:hypothetical protein [Armatimonadota bacterium]
MEQSVSHDRADESLDAKAAWFAEMSVQDRLDCFCEFMEMALAANPHLLEARDAQPIPGRVQVLELPRG